MIIRRKLHAGTKLKSDFFFLLQAPFAVNGYVGTDLDWTCFVTDDVNMIQFWVVDMNSPKNVSRIVHQSRFFVANSVQLRAGLDPDIFKNPVVATVTYGENFEIQPYEFQPPILVRYIGITGIDNSQFELCEVMAFE